VWTAAIAAVAAVVAVAPWAYRIALVGSGFSAEILCGGVFISGRDEAAVTSEDLSGPGYAPLHLFHKTIDLNEKRVTASLFGLAKQIAIFRDGLGCTLIDGREEAALRGHWAVVTLRPSCRLIGPTQVVRSSQRRGHWCWVASGQSATMCVARSYPSS